VPKQMSKSRVGTSKTTSVVISSTIHVIDLHGAPRSPANSAVRRRSGGSRQTFPGALRRFLLGSVTAKVLHDVSAAVWTGVGSNLADHQPRVPYSSIICALDETEEAEVVLKGAAAIACSYGAQLFLLHVVATPPMALEIDFAPYRKELMDAADLRLRELKEKLGIHAPHFVTDAMMLDSIREEALRRKADLIVTGRGEAQGNVSRIWSRLYPLIRDSPCPVLSV